MLNNLSYNIRRLEIETKVGIFNISDKFQSFVFHDSIFSPTMTGTITIKDSINFLKEYKFDGTETLIVDLEKTDCTQTFKKMFIIYNDGVGNRLNDNTEQYILKFASREYLLSREKRVYSTYKNTYSGIVTSILLEDLDVEPQEINIDKSIGIRDIVFSNKTPLSCIIDCAKKAIDEDESATFMFFENKYGFHFTSLSTIAKKQPKFKYNYNPKNFTGSIDPLYGIIKFNVVKQYNVTDQIDNGMHGINVVSFDPLQRSMKITPMTFEQLTRGNSNLNKGSVSVNTPRFTADNARNFPNVSYPVGPGAFSGGASKLISEFETNMSDDSDKYAKRKTQLGKYFNTRVRLVVPGNFDLVSGSVIEVQIPLAGIKGSDSRDEHLSGNYMIIGVKHKLNIHSHETVLEISKDSTVSQTIYESVESSLDDYYGPHTTNVYESETE